MRVLCIVIRSNIFSPVVSSVRICKPTCQYHVLSCFDVLHWRSPSNSFLCRGFCAIIKYSEPQLVFALAVLCSWSGAGLLLFLSVNMLHNNHQDQSGTVLPFFPASSLLLPGTPAAVKYNYSSPSSLFAAHMASPLSFDTLFSLPLYRYYIILSGICQYHFSIKKQKYKGARGWSPFLVPELSLTVSPSPVDCTWIIFHQS